MNVPVAILGLVAVAALVPKSRAPVRPGIDLLGIVVSSAGLVGLTYGLIEAGPNGWTDGSTLAPLGVGLALLVVFVLWELRQTRLPGGQPLVDLTLFRSASFTWGVTLAALVVVAMFGALFTLPQYFQGVMGVDAQGSGLRLLPVIAGVVLGGLPADRVRSWIGPKLTVTLGLVVLAVGMLVGARTTVSSGDAFIAAWLLVCGIGMGLALVTAAAAALIEIPAERSGTGSALMQAFQKLGAPFGAAILGSVLSSTYQAQLQLAGLPPALAGVVRGSVFGGLAIAGRLHSAALLATVKESFVNGMDVSLVVCAGIAILGALLALAFLPGRTVAATGTEPGGTPSDRAIA
jgi:predicted MFS family arabinose efflux permease